MIQYLNIHIHVYSMLIVMLTKLWLKSLTKNVGDSTTLLLRRELMLKKVAP